MDSQVRPTKQRFWIVTIMCIGIMIAFLDRVNVSVLAANETFLMDMDIVGQPVKIGMMMSVFLIVYGISNFFLCPLGAYLGPRKAMMLAILGMGVSLIVGGIAGTFIILLASRAILGITEGFYYPMQSAVVKNWFPPNERGRANAVWTIGQSISPAFAMPLFTFIIAYWGWRSSFFVSLVLTMIPLVLMWFYLTDKPSQSKHVNEAELKYITDGFEQEKETQFADTAESSLVERVKVFASNYHYWILVYFYMSMNFMYWGLVSWLPTYLKVARGFTWAEMGWLASLPFILTIITKALNGVISDKIGRCAPSLFLAMLLGGIFVYLAASVEGKYASALLLACAFGTTSMATPVAWTLLQKFVPSNSVPTAAGIMNGISTGVSSLSPILIGFFISLVGYAGGLYVIVGTGLIAAAVELVLVIQKY